MSTINPTYLRVLPPTENTVLDALKSEIKKELSCVKIGVIQSFDAATQEVTVKIAQQQVTAISPDGVKTFADYPLLVRVPVCFPAGGGFTLTFPILAGDECIVLFNDRELENWLINGPGYAPNIARFHDIADGIAIVGIRSNPRALADVSAVATQLRSDDGTTFVEANAQGIKVHSGSVYEWDCHGYGQRITWTGGSSYTIDNYTTGATVTTNNHPINPPGPV